MAFPERIGGPEEKKPGLVVAIGLKKPGLPKNIGGPSDDGEGDSGGEMDNEKAKEEAVKEIMAAINDRSDLRLKSALEAFFLAVDAEPHAEGEHDGEGAEDGEEE
jgi:hypothetical protein